MKDWFLLYATQDAALASIVKGLLEENNITVIILNKQSSSYINFGDIQLYVPAHLKDIAKNLLDNGLLN